MQTKLMMAAAVAFLGAMLVLARNTKPVEFAYNCPVLPDDGPEYLKINCTHNEQERRLKILASPLVESFDYCYFKEVAGLKQLKGDSADTLYDKYRPCAN